MIRPLRYGGILPLFLAVSMLIGCRPRTETTSAMHTLRPVTTTALSTTLPKPTQRPVTTTSPIPQDKPTIPEGAYSWNPYVFDRLAKEYQEDATRLADAILAYDPSVGLSPGAAEVLCDNFAFEFPPAALVDLTAEGDAISITYLFSKEEHLEKIDAFAYAVNRALAILSPEDGEAMRARLLYDYVVENVSYFYTDYTDKEITAFSALVAGKSICYGFADAFGYLLRQTGMEAHLWRGGTYRYDGFSEHGWCYAMVDGRYYHFDPTWEYSATKNSGINQHLYFGLTDARRFTSLSRECVWGFGKLEEVCDTTLADWQLQIVN